MSQLLLKAMFDRKHLERILKINGASVSASDDEIRVVLRSAHYGDDEIVSALTVLRGGADPSTTGSGIHKLMHTDQVLSSKEISRLLGIDVVLPVTKRRRLHALTEMPTNVQRFVIVLLSIVVAITGLGLAMYLLEFGVFHATAAIVPYGW